MITTAEFYDQLKLCNPLFYNHGLIRKRQNVFRHVDGFRLQFIVDKHKWSEEDGAGFIVRFIDERCEDEVTIFDLRGMREITPSVALRDGLLTPKEVESIYKGVPATVKKYFDLGYSFSYYEQKDLRRLIEILVPRILDNMGTWIINRKKVKTISREVAPEAEKALALEQFDKLFKDFIRSPEDKRKS